MKKSVLIFAILAHFIFVARSFAGAGWLFNWNYRKPIAISNSGAAATDYQVLVTTDTAFLIAAGKMLADGSDIRFTDADGAALLGYWIESGINTPSTKIWVKTPSVPAGSKTIYMYYGSPLASSLSSVAGTFIREISGVRGAWSMDEGSGSTAADASGNGNNGSLTNTPWTASGRFGSALDFTGSNDYATITANASLNTSSVTVAMWTKMPAAMEAVALSKTIDSSPWVEYRGLITNAGGTYQGQVVNTAETSYQTPAAGSLLVDTCTHTAMVFNGPTIKLYLNGAEISSLGASGSIIQNNAPIYFGIHRPADQNNWNGFMDEVYIYDQPLSPAEISDLADNYGYHTLNYAGKTLVRKYSSPEPMTNTGAEEFNTSFFQLLE